MTHVLDAPAPVRGATVSASRWMAVGPCMVACAGAIGELAWPNSHALMLALTGAVTAVQVGALRASTREAVPLAALVIAVLNSVGAAGYYFFDAVADKGDASSRVLTTDAGTYRAAAITFATASLCLWTGALVAARPGRPTAIRLPRLTRPVGSWVLLSTGSVPIVLHVVGQGWHEVLIRTGYQTVGGPVLLIKAGSLLTPIGMTLAALVVFDPNRKSARSIGVAMLVVYFGLALSRDTRGIGLLPVCLLIGAFATGRRIRRRTVLVTALATAFLFQLPLALRGDAGDSAGLIPYAHQLAHDPGSAFVSEPYSVLGNLLFSVPLTGVVATQEHFPRKALITSLDPLPGQFTDWEDIKSGLRVNSAVPFSGLGELASSGYGWLVAVFLLLGAGLTAAQRAIAALPGLRSTGGFVVGSALTIFLSVGLLEYNLRSDLRYFWDLGALVLLLRCWPTCGPDPSASSALPPRSDWQAGR